MSPKPQEYTFSKNDWLALSRQLDALRAFWDLRRAACGAAWIADYGPLPCDLPAGHAEPHRCYGAEGPIRFTITATSTRTVEVTRVA